jgi:hypothetical protein
MKVVLNKSQKEKLSDFLNNIAVAWFSGAFIASSLLSTNWLTFIIYLVNMSVALGFSLYLVKEEK